MLNDSIPVGHGYFSPCHSQEARERRGLVIHSMVRSGPALGYGTQEAGISCRLDRLNWSRINTWEDPSSKSRCWPLSIKYAAKNEGSTRSPSLRYCRKPAWLGFGSSVALTGMSRDIWQTLPQCLNQHYCYTWILFLWETLKELRLCVKVLKRNQLSGCA